MQAILVYLYVILYLLLGLPYLGIEWLLAKGGEEAAKKSALRQYHFVMWGFRCVLFLTGARVHVEGRENIPEDEPVLYVGNHRGIFDIVAAAPYMAHNVVTGFICKNSISKVPSLRIYMRRISCLFIERDDIKQSLKVILAAIENVKKGCSVVIYPEGTRNKNKEDSTDMAPFKEGSFKVAQKSGCKIIPIAATGTAEVFEDALPLMHSGDIYISFGQPIDMKELDKETQKHIGEYCQEKVREMLIKQRNQIEGTVSQN